MSAKSNLLAALDSTKDEQIKLLQSFVHAASPNPPGDTIAAAKVLVDYLLGHGITAEIIEAQPGLQNVISDFQGGAGPGPRVVLNGHMDVFPVPANTDGWTRDPWSGAVESGRVHGRGVVDMKSGTASLVVAYAALFAQKKHIRGSVALCAVADEETGGRWGTQYLIKKDPARWGGDVMLSAEPTGQTVRFSEKGTLRMSGSVATKGALGAYLNLSKGAIRTATSFLAQVVQEVESINPTPPPEIDRHMKNPETLAAVDHAMGPGASMVIARPTVNIGTIKGGLKVNMIPELCTFEIDIRLPIGLVADQVLAVIESIKPHYPDAKIELKKQEAASNPNSFSSIEHPLLGYLIENAEKVGAARPALIPSMGATDCKHYRYAGVPAYVYGCSPESMAATNESASVDEYLHVTKVHALATWDFLQ
ncbi:hypothetical protein N7468_002411 [Penicillium chermesinum]|uniref:Peptidase M20 dimerisation domain-containing protein n=1 Tax=Penicillium chermesinum TaxID=63820 RepID=A0A9W9PIG6_9EURO|nr:uncharacterized protein N7468_002411 [Penicillium chermesinum]KAJ5247428.1 hypothetical protein N7468_002411 [Penicillium chermesinum]KAJ6145667.1 hypothetical protein N7470_009562 [Penicillium chermesinum]